MHGHALERNAAFCENICIEMEFQFSKGCKSPTQSFTCLSIQSHNTTNSFCPYEPDLAQKRAIPPTGAPQYPCPGPTFVLYELCPQHLVRSVCSQTIFLRGTDGRLQPALHATRPRTKVETGKCNGQAKCQQKGGPVLNLPDQQPRKLSKNLLSKVKQGIIFQGGQ